jgi:hypothetical protein
MQRCGQVEIYRLILKTADVRNVKVLSHVHKLPELAHLLVQAKLFVMPSHHEGRLCAAL